jgi:hypothetical protein
MLAMGCGGRLSIASKLGKVIFEKPGIDPPRAKIRMLEQALQ